MKKRIIAIAMIALLVVGCVLPTFAEYDPRDYDQAQDTGFPGGVTLVNTSINASGYSEFDGRVVIKVYNTLLGSPPPEITFYFYQYPSTVSTPENTARMVYNFRVKTQDSGAMTIFNSGSSQAETGWYNSEVYYIRFTSAINSNTYNTVFGAEYIEFVLQIDSDFITDTSIFANSFVTINQPPMEILPEIPPWGDETDPETLYNLGYDTGYYTGETIGYQSGYNAGYNAGYSDGRNSQVSNGVFSGIGSFLTTTIGGFMDFELMPNISIGGVLTCIVGLYGLFALLRYFAGG